MGVLEPHTFGDWQVEGVAYLYQQMVMPLRRGDLLFLTGLAERETPSTMENPEHTILVGGRK